MDYGDLVSESIEYTREALTGRWTTLLVFILCSLPMALIQFTFDPNTLVDEKTAIIRWEIIPWPQIIALCAAGFLLSFILSGYSVRVFRGTTPPPVFDQWGSLYLDGIRYMIVSIIWFIPALIVLGSALALFFFGGTGPSPGLILAAFLLLLAAFGLIVVADLYCTLGVIRFARTGSIGEGVHFSAISGTIGRIGWVTYIIALLVLFVAGVVFTLIGMVLAFIPFIGWVLVLPVNPFIQVFTARYLSHVYDHGISGVLVTAPGETP
jgi:hypothetical protein